FKEIKYFKSFLVYMKKIHFISVLKLMGMYGDPSRLLLAHRGRVLAATKPVADDYKYRKYKKQRLLLNTVPF
ncbi:hypothetical protein, partial [Bacillus cereus]